MEKFDSMVQNLQPQRTKGCRPRNIFDAHGDRPHPSIHRGLLGILLGAPCATLAQTPCVDTPLGFRQDIRLPDAWELAWESTWPDAREAMAFWRADNFLEVQKLWLRASPVQPHGGPPRRPTGFLQVRNGCPRCSSTRLHAATCPAAALKCQTTFGPPWVPPTRLSPS